MTRGLNLNSDRIFSSCDRSDMTGRHFTDIFNGKSNRAELDATATSYLKVIGHDAGRLNPDEKTWSPCIENFVGLFSRLESLNEGFANDGTHENVLTKHHVSAAEVLLP